MAVVLLMVVPLPPLLLDLLLSIDIGLAVVLLLTAIYVRQPVEFSVFPSLLLLLTLIRLSLNVASTRLILMHGADGVDAAGHVIMSFGQFVVGGNFVVGIVVFLVLIAIQFIVINHGAVRISEVTARFTLDAMPGRQMAIDADLNAGAHRRAARRATRRDRVRREADFYGAMDGAIRFTQRDALAAVLITGVNIVAGLIIGVFQHGLDLATAAQTYTILTVGEGLVTAIPGAARLDVGRPDHDARRVRIAPRRGSRGAVAGARRGRWPSPPACSTALALIPGLPKLSFLVVAALLGGAAYVNARRAPRTPREPTRRPTRRPRRRDAPVAGRSARASKSATRSSRSSTRSRAARCSTACARSAGRSRPKPAWSCRRCTSPTTCSSGRATYAILVKGVEVARGELFPDRLLAINPGTATTPLEGIADARAGVRPAGVVDRRRRSANARSAAGYTVVDPTTALSTHLSETIRTFLPDLLSRQQTKELLDRVGADVAEAGRGARAEGACRSATCSACCGSCCASACRSAISSEPGVQAAQRGRRPPVPPAEQRHRGRYEQAAHDRGVDERPRWTGRARSARCCRSGRPRSSRTR